MHYDDDFIKENAEFIVVIYKHTTNTPTHSYHIASIQSCKFIHPYELSDFISKFDEPNDDFNQDVVEKRFPEFASMKTERFCKVTFEIHDFSNLKVKEIKEISLDELQETPEYGLH